MSTKVLLGIILLSWGLASVQAAEVIVYTEDYPPYNYLAKDGEAGGYATEKVRQVLDATGLSYEIRVIPWVRAMKRIREEENSLIYTITRTEERETQFDWLVPLAKANFHLYARREDQRTFTIDNLKAGKYSAACVAADLTCLFLKNMGVPENRIVQIPDSRTGDFRLVVVGRVDLYMSEMLTNKYMRRKEGFSHFIVKPVIKADLDMGFYLASGPNVHKKTRDKVRKTYKRLKEEGAYQLIDTTMNITYWP